MTILLEHGHSTLQTAISQFLVLTVTNRGNHMPCFFCISSLTPRLLNDSASVNSEMPPSIRTQDHPVLSTSLNLSFISCTVWSHFQFSASIFWLLNASIVLSASDSVHIYPRYGSLTKLVAETWHLKFLIVSEVCKNWSHSSSSVWLAFISCFNSLLWKTDPLQCDI